MKYEDLLAVLGEGSAHPGGFVSTLGLLQKIQIPSGSNILEVGCGTGRTACHLAKCGHHVTAVDRHCIMLDKAKRRSLSEGVQVNFIESDACDLCFEKEMFDVVFIESVNVFVDLPKCLNEYSRILKKGGHLFDREMVLRGRKCMTMIRNMKNFYGMKNLIRIKEWIKYFKCFGFKEVMVCERSGSFLGYEGDYDDQRELNPQILYVEEVIQMSDRNAQLLHKYSRKLGNAVFSAKKPCF